jgi:hypothetical protein
MIYQYLQNIDDTDKVVYFGLTVIIALILVRFNPSWQVLVGLAVGAGVIYYLADRKLFLADSYLYRMLEILASSKFDPARNRELYLDAQLAEFLHEVREFHNYNPALYRNLVHQCNEFLRLADQINKGTAAYQLDFRNLRHQKYQILNLYQSAIVSMPYTQATKEKFEKGLTTLKTLLNRHIDDIQRLTVTRDQERGVDTNSAFVYLAAPHPLDPAADPHYDYFSQSD